MLSGHCSHIIGLLKTLQGFKLHNLTSVPEQQSCTSIPRQWGHLRGMKIKPIPMSHVVVERPTAEVRKRKPVLCQLNTQKKLPLVESSDVKKLRQLDGTPLGYILSEDGPTVDTLFGKVPVGSLLSYQTRNLKHIEASVGTGCGNTLFPKTAHVKLTDEYLCLNKDFALVDAEKMESQT
ncbi:uncharacterized protein LOC121385365 [Gigantopelta aegis]|uniref:uncharacterized protein LOC121385365 n=1 Tax=Gigantopelta aegis TaxID=1735272 RepID=UPI001B889D5E|nr:uncharacterized protein LOC121385365 [Gigantopelta aegis]